MRDILLKPQSKMRLLLASLCVFKVLADTKVQMRDLTNNGAWQFRQVGNTTWLPADVPSTFHLDLIQNGLVPDPYYRDNQMQFYKYELEDWEYRTSFSVDSDTLSKPVIELVFEGLDTHANVTLNGQLIAQTNNMHRTWVVDVKSVLSSNDTNNLTVYFASSAQFDLDAV